MHLKAFLIACLSALVHAQSGANPVVPLTATLQAGQPYTVQWAPNTPGTVSLQLRWGSAGNLNSGVPIASSIPNTGSFSWTPDPNLKAGSDYTIEIVSDADKAQTNFSPVFGLLSDGKGIEPSAPPAATTTTTTENPAASSSAAASSSHEASKSAESAASKTSSKVQPTTNAASRFGGGAAALAGLGAVVGGML